MKKILLCPKCRTNLFKDGKTLKCCSGHTYDIAKQGYVNLILGSSGSGGDDKAMCRSRHNFHSEDHYKCLSERLADICVSGGFNSIIDAGCGEGYYLRKIRDRFQLSGASRLEALCGIDLAKEAIAIGARAERDVDEEYKIEYAVAGIFDMPLADSVADCVLSVFAPVPDKEALRVLKSSGVLVVVSPGEKHLEGLKSVLYDSIYDNEMITKEYDGFSLVERQCVDDTITVYGENITDLFHMTPYYWKTSEKDAAKLMGLSELTTKIEFVISIYKKNENNGTFGTSISSNH